MPCKISLLYKDFSWEQSLTLFIASVVTGAVACGGLLSLAV